MYSKAIALFVFITIFISACKDNTPDPINEEELITTLEIAFTPPGGGTPVIFRYRDLDGDGGSAPEITTGVLAKNTTYSVSVQLLNEAADPTINIAEEVEEEGSDHQFFFIPTANLELTFNYSDSDDNGNPIGLSAVAGTGAASSGELTVILRHKPLKSAAGVASGDITNAAGDTDLEVTFSVTIL